VQFRKDGGTVGSIGVESGKLVVNSQGSNLVFAVGGTTELNLDGTQFYPQTDGGLDLGHPSVRWKDLRLSGGVYLGGTGSDNLLNDYEVGTWTPRLRGSASEPGTLTTGTGTYTKIGRLVTVTWQFSSVSTTGYSGTLSIDQITFSPTLSFMSGGDVMFNLMATFPTGTSNISCYLTSSSNSILFYGSESQAGWTALTHNAGSSGRYSIGSLTYETTS